MTDRDEQQQAAIDEFLDLLQHDRRGDAWVGQTPDWFGPVVFGGIGLAAHDQRRVRRRPGGQPAPLRARPLPPTGAGRTEIVFRSEVVKSGRTFNLHRVTASQDGKAVITMTCSFTADTDGYVYDLSGIPDDVPLPDDAPRARRRPEHGIGPWDTRWLGPSPLRPDGTREATHRHWFRLPRQLDDDPHLHAALLGYATDWTGIGGGPSTSTATPPA